LACIDDDAGWWRVDDIEEARSARRGSEARGPAKDGLRGILGVACNGLTEAGLALPAGKYRVKASFKDARGNLRSITGYTSISWRRATWKSVSVIRYADARTYYVSEFGGTIYYSLDYPHGRILDLGAMIRDCMSCGWAGGRFVFAVKADVLEYRSMFMQIRGHGFIDREHPGSASLVNPATGLFALTNANCEYDQPGVICGIPFTSRYVSSTDRVVAWVWMTQAWATPMTCTT
jgi:hypothetical protein